MTMDSEMNKDFTMTIIQNDLDSMALRIESLEAHTELTNAGELVRQAKQAVLRARNDIHQRDTRARLVA